MNRAAVGSVVVSFAVFVVAWKLVVLVGGYPPFILPSPEVVGLRFIRAWADGIIEPHAVATLIEIGLGFAVGAGTGLLVGYALARSTLVERIISPYVVAAQATPILALAPLLALWFGPGLISKVVICGLIVFFPIAVSTMVGEWAGADRGLGVLVNLARGSLFDIPLMFATLATIAMVGIALYLVVVFAERRLVGVR